MRTLRLHSEGFQRGNWACVFTMCLSMWKAQNWCELMCVDVLECVGVWVDTVCAIRFLVHRSRENHQKHKLENCIFKDLNIKFCWVFFFLHKTTQCLRSAWSLPHMTFIEEGSNVFQ